MITDAGQGACQSVGDAAVLAIAAGNSQSARKVIRDNKKQRIRRTTHVVNYYRKIGTLSNCSTPVSVKLRELMFRMIPKERLTTGFEKITDIDF